MAPVYDGPQRPGAGTAPAVPAPVVVRITPSLRVSNAGILSMFGQTTLAQGASGEATRVLQRALQLTVDGSFGPQTAAAVSAFQAQQGLPVTGWWSPADWRVLFPVPPVAPVLAANVAVLRDFGQLTLSVGATGAAVAKVQQALRVSVDGVFGPQTAGAVTRLQTEQEIPVTGSWGPREWSLMFPAPAPTSTTSPASVAPLRLAVTVAGGPQHSPAYASQFVITGKATAGSLVTLHFRKAGAPVGEYAIVRTVTADAFGSWTRPILANAEYRYYATSDSGRSDTVLNTPSPTVDGPAARLVPLRHSYRLTGHALPGSTVLLNFHNADMAPGDYSVVRTVIADADGFWSRTYVPAQDCRVFVSRPDGQASGALALLLQAR